MLQEVALHRRLGGQAEGIGFRCAGVTPKAPEGPCGNQRQMMSGLSTKTYNVLDFLLRNKSRSASNSC